MRKCTLGILQIRLLKKLHVFSFIPLLESAKVKRLLATLPPPPPPSSKQERQGDPPRFYFRPVLNLSQDRAISIPYYHIIDNNHICFQIINFELSFSPYQNSSLHLFDVLLSPIPPPPPRITDGSILPSWGCLQVKILFYPCKKSFICQCGSIKVAEY